MSDKVETIKNADYFFRQISTKTGIFRLYWHFSVWEDEYYLNARHPLTSDADGEFGR